MTTSPGIERKVRQLDNDVSAIYEMLAAIQGTQTRHGNRLTEIGEQLAAHDLRFEGLEGRLDGVEGRLDGVEQRLDGMAGQLGEVLELLRGR